MKLTLILLTATFLQVTAATYAQKVTLKAKQATLKDVFEQIRNQTNYDFLYNSDDLKVAGPVTIDLNGVSIDQAMNLCLSNQPLTYSIENKTILITKKATSLTNNANIAKRITGVVTDTKGVPLPGVTVREKGSSIAGAVTDVNGKFVINVSDGNATLTFSFIGFINKEVPLNGKSVIDVELTESQQGLNEVVVVGYGTQKKETVTGAISSIGTKDLVQSPVANISNALAGRLSGLTVVQTSGKPGSDGAALSVRGVGTYTGVTSPLVMVDGIARDSFDDIDPNEVETISILKDASATAVYGVRGANGVILITTKRGKEGAPKVSAMVQTAISQFVNMPDFVNSYQYATLLNEQSYENYWIQHAKDPGLTWNTFAQNRDANWAKEATLYYSPEDLKYYQNAHTPTINGQKNPYYDPYGHPDQDWKAQMFNKWAPETQANANITGGTKSVKYFVSLGYLSQGGLFNTSYMPFGDDMQFQKKRYNLRSNLDFDVTKDFKVSVDVSTQYVTVKGMDNDEYTWEKRILWSSPLSSAGLVDGKFVVPFANQNDQLNPLYAIASSNNYNINTNSTLNSAITLTHKLNFITEGLSVTAKGAYDSYFQDRSYGKFTPLLYGIRPNPNGDLLNPIIVQVSNDAAPFRSTDYYTNKWRKVYGEFDINYNRTFAKKHVVTGLILASAEKRYDPNYVPDLPHAYESVAGRVTYAYDNRYLAEYDMGYNGSENFPEGKRFGFFPAYSAGWIASNESFFPKSDYVTYFKIRGSLGKVGNDGVNIPGTQTPARYLYLPDTWKYDNGGYNNSGGYTFGTLNDRNNIQGALEAVLGNPDVTWEVSTKSNIGAEAHLFNEHLSVVYDHFNEHRKNILSYKGSVPGIVSATLPPYNLGEVKNWGNEIELTYNSSPGKFTWWVKGNASTNKNKIIFEDEAIAPGLEYQAATGRPINQGSYLDAQGLYTSWSQLYAIDGNGNPILSQPVLALDKNGKPYNNAAGTPVYQKDLGFAGAPVQPGEVRLRDVNGDGIVNEKDYIKTGKTDLPELSYGLSFGFKYKGFDFSALLQGVGGVAKYAMQELHFNKQQSLFQVDENRFTQERYDAGDRIDFPIAAYNQDGAYNTFFLKSTAYVRLKNMEIGYTLKPSFLKAIGVRTARFYINGYNLYTWSPNKIWGDPEDLGFVGYPLTRTFNLGASVSF